MINVATLTFSLIIAATVAPTSTLQPKAHSLTAVAAETARAKVLPNTIRSAVFADGSEWVTHPVFARNESSPMGVTRFAADGSSTLFLASDWLPKQAIPGGLVGQIYGVADLGGGAIAATVGWNDGGDVHNALLFLDRTSGGRYAPRKMVELAGAADVAAGPDGSALVVTTSAAVPGGGPMVTLIERDGTIAGAFFPGDESLDRHAAARNGIGARLQHIEGRRYALYDPAGERIRIFELSPAKRATVIATLFLGNDAELAKAPVIGIRVTSAGVAYIARTAVLPSGPRTVITAISSRGAEGTWISQHPWRATLATENGMRGLVQRGTLLVETVAFDGR